MSRGDDLNRLPAEFLLYLLAEGRRPIVWIEPQATNLLPRPFQTSSFCHSDVTTKLSMKRPPALARDNPSQYHGRCKTPVHYCCLHSSLQNHSSRYLCSELVAEDKVSKQLCSLIN